MKKLFLVTALAIAMVGCASAKYTVHPGAINLFDSQTYDTLLVTHTVIESAKADLASGKFPSTVASGVKLAVDNLVTAYNVADTAYQAYHIAASAGNVTPAQTAAVSTAISNVNTATINLSSAKAGS